MSPHQSLYKRAYRSRHAGDTFYFMRRAGVIGWFGLTYIAQLQLGACLRRHPHWGNVGQRLVQLSLVTLLIGLISVVAGLLVPERHDELESAFEWTLALLLNVHGFIVAMLWRRSGFAMSPQLTRQ